MAQAVALVYPHQLYRDQPAVAAASHVWLIEDPLFFTQYHFHKQKIVLHRASMREYAEELRQRGKDVTYVEASQLQRTEEIGLRLAAKRVRRVSAVEPSDQWLRERVERGCAEQGIAVEWLEDTAYMTPDDVQQQWLQGREKFFFTDFYIQQRKRLGCLLDDNGKPAGGKWTFDTENRKKLPKGTRVPKLWKPGERDSVGEARRYVHQHFPNAVGDDAGFWFPVTHQDARRWLKNFLDHRFEDFGIYEDAIAAEETTLFHSVLTPMLNIGLITPAEVIESALSKIDDVPMNSLEGFIRQVIGWREFVRMIYLHQGRRQRTHNFWGFKRSLPKSFYDGTTGIDPLDQVIRRVLKHAYSHHIERLMVLGNFMLLCEINPHHVYRWFMELYVDAYDWVMVPNVYGMSQFADGGLMTTKPYISGSSYVLRMSDFKKGDWCPVWDALYWRFIHNHREFFAGNPRMSVMVKQLDKMGDKLKTHLTNADRFLNRL